MSHERFVGHGGYRMETRFGLKTEAEKNRFAKEAWEKGERPSAMDSKRKAMTAYLSAREMMAGKIVKLHKGVVFVFSKNSHKLVTCYEADKEILEKDVEECRRG